MSKEIYASAYNIAKMLTEKEKSDRGLTKNSDAFYYVALKYRLGCTDEIIEDSITDLSYVLGNAVNGQLRDAGIDAVYIDREEKEVYLFNFKYQEHLKRKNFPSDECDKMIGYLQTLFAYDSNAEYYFNDKLKSKTQEIVDFMDTNLVKIKVVFASNYFEGLEISKKEVFENALSEINENITFEEFHLSELMHKYIYRDYKSYVGVCAVNKDLMFPKKSNGEVELFIVKIKALDLLKLFVDDERKRLQSQALSPADIVSHGIQEELFDDNVRVYLSKSNKVNKKILETAKNQAQDFFFYNNGVTVLCDKCVINAGTPNKMRLTNYQVVNGGQTIHAIYEAAKADYNCLETVEVLCRIFAGTDENQKRKIARYTNTQTPVTERDLSALDYVQILLSEEFLLKGLYYERKAKQYKGSAPTKLRYDSYKMGQLLLAFALGKPHIARSNKKEVFLQTYVDQIFNKDLTADTIVKLCRLYAWLQSAGAEQKNDCKNAWLYVVYFYKIVFEKYREPLENNTLPEVLDIDFSNPAGDTFAQRCYDVTFKVIKYVIQKKQAEQGLDYDDSNYFKTEYPVREFNDALSRFGATLEDIESATLSVEQTTPETPEAV